ncbi:hypothetical protein [Kineococcus sp. SYSU DK018]|uniref:hypothetical protein n=1 Tax=Kineococcus sp. SYSU DK018 TaxID=3383139 RepID=UPI003D7CE5E3
MSMEDLHAVPDPSVGDWLAPRLSGDFGAVGWTVPRGYAAYARVLHPVNPEPAAEPTTWAGVCARTGRTAHALMQWESITTPAPGTVGLPLSGEGRWDEVQVERGCLAPQALSPLLDVLAPFTADHDGPQACHHALWEGWGWLAGTNTLVVAFRDGPGPHPRTPVWTELPEVVEDALNAPRLSLPGREYLLFAGPLHAALGMGDRVTDDWFLPQSPNLLWPADRSWCLASEIDFDSTLIGGPAELIAAVLAAPGLEAWPVDEDDDLSAFADHLNT